MISAPSTTADEMRLRPQSSRDDAFVRALYAQTRQRELEPLGWSDEQRSAFIAMQFEGQRRHYRAQYPDAELLIVESGDEPIGRLYLNRTAEEIRIIDITLRSDCRGAGIGGGLIRTLLAEATRDAKVVTLHVEKSNPARRLYGRCGFVPVADNDPYLQMRWTPSNSGAFHD